MNVGDFRHAGTVQSPTRTADGRGGYTESWADVSGSPGSPWWFSIESATAANMQRLAAGGEALQSSATHILHGRYHDGITTRTRIVEGARVFNVLGVQNIREDDMFTRAFVTEVIS